MYTPDPETKENDEDEVKVLSHKEQRRLKKKLAKEGSNESKVLDNGSKQDERKKLKTGPAKARVEEKEDSRLKRQNSIWVGNLSYKTTPDALRAFFKDAGEVTRVHMPTKADQNNRGYAFSFFGSSRLNVNSSFAYVDFTSPDAKVIAITFSEKNLGKEAL